MIFIFFRKYKNMLSRNEKINCTLNQDESAKKAPVLDPKAIHNEADLLVAAIHIDRYLMDAMNRLDKDFSEIHTLAMLTFKQLNSNKLQLNDKVTNNGQTPSEDVSRSLDKITLYNEQMEKKADTPIFRLQRLCASCDRSITFYRDVVETTSDEAVLLTAKKLLASAFERIRLLKQALGEDCGCVGSIT